MNENRRKILVSTRQINADEAEHLLAALQEEQRSSLPIYQLHEVTVDAGRDNRKTKVMLFCEQARRAGHANSSHP